MSKRIQDQGTESVQKREKFERNFDEEVSTLNGRILNATDKLRKAELLVERAQVYVDRADKEKDSTLQRTSRLAKFEADYEKAKPELELQIVAAKADKESAKTERDRERADEDLDDARNELKKFKEQLPGKLAEKRVQLAHEFPIDIVAPLPVFVSRSSNSIGLKQLSFVRHGAYDEALSTLKRVLSKVPTAEGRDLFTVGLVGAMGVGKTRTAIEACNAAADYEVQQGRSRPLVLYGRTSLAWKLDTDMDSLALLARAIVIANDELQVDRSVTFREVVEAAHRDGFSRVILYIDEVQIDRKGVGRIVEGCSRTMTNTALGLVVVPFLSGITLPNQKTLPSEGSPKEIFIKPLNPYEFLHAFAHEISLTADEVKASKNWNRLLELCAGAPNVVDHMTRAVKELKEANEQFARNFKLIDERSATAIYEKTLDGLKGAYGPKRWHDLIRGSRDDVTSDDKVKMRASYKEISLHVMRVLFLTCFTGVRITDLQKRVGTNDQDDERFPTFARCLEAGIFSYDATEARLSMALMGLMSLNAIIDFLPAPINDPFSSTWASFEFIGPFSIYLRLRLAQLQGETSMSLGDLRPGTLCAKIENIRIAVPSKVEFHWLGAKATGVPSDAILLGTGGHGAPVELFSGFVAMAKDGETAIDGIVILNDTQEENVVILCQCKSREKNVGNGVPAETVLHNGTIVSKIIPAMMRIKDRYQAQFGLPEATIFVYDVFSDRVDPENTVERLPGVEVPYFVTRNSQILPSAGWALAQLSGNKLSLVECGTSNQTEYFG